MICADTSFLISLYGMDANTPAAGQQSAGTSYPIHVNAVIDFEFHNAVRLLVFRQKIAPAQRLSRVAAYQADKTAGLLVVSGLDTNAVFVEAEVISAAHGEQGGHRGYDILIVAAAKLIGAKEFWSFDGKQRALAAAEGFTVGP